MSLFNLSEAFEDMRRARDYWHGAYVNAIPCQCMGSGSVSSDGKVTTSLIVRCFKCIELEKMRAVGKSRE